MTLRGDTLTLTADVLIVGGGLAGTWAAVGAARAGARVVLADKGYCGTSGITAPSGPGHWWVPPDPELRTNAINQRLAIAGGLADPDWMARILDLTWRTLPTLADYYTFPVDERGVTQYRGLRGPEYLRGMRRLIEDLGVRILDQSPALELLRHPDGAVAGVRGARRQAGGFWTVRAGAVVLATGGCAFKSRLLGCHTNTGDGHLMAAEAGAEFSGMEFSSYYTVAPAFSTMTRSMSYSYARYSNEAGHAIPVPQGAGTTPALARALLAGPVFCRLDRMPQETRDRLRRVQPNVMLPFDRAGIDPFHHRFPVTLHGEGTIRGTGGLRIADAACQTSVPGLYAAGDVATRELVAGAASGGGAVNSAWALSSGLIAGQGAAERARTVGDRSDQPADPIGEAGLRPRRTPAADDRGAIVTAVQEEMHPYDKNVFRSGAKLSRSLGVLDGLWGELRDHLAGGGVREPVRIVKARESAALVAVGRWCYAAALARGESRGLHQREDAPHDDRCFDHRLLTGGLDTVWTKPEQINPRIGGTP